MTASAAEVLTADYNAAPSVQPAPLVTFEQWANMDEEARGEFVDGRIVEEEVPSVLHEIIVRWLIRTLDVWGAPREYPVFGSELKLRVARGRGRKPDVSVFPQGTRLRDVPFLRKPPLLVIEVVSRQSRDVKRDRLEKRKEYAQFGVQHYWIVDPDVRIFDFWTLGPDGRWHELTDSASEGRVEVAGFDELVLDLDALWREVDAIIEPGQEDEMVDDEG